MNRQLITYKSLLPVQRNPATSGFYIHQDLPTIVAIILSSSMIGVVISFDIHWPEDNALR